MADLDLETVEKVLRWCAEAGRQSTSAEVRAALGVLGWDELLAARALLAEPPPLRQLGPHALADMARGAPADVAAEREREGRYPKAPPAGEIPPPAAPAAGPATPRKRVKARAMVIVRKKAPAPAEPPPPRQRPVLDELLLPAGRAALGRLVRVHGGKRPAILAALAVTHRRPDGQPLADGDLDRLLDEHGMARSFARRELDEVLHAVRAAGGVLPRAAAALGHEPAGLAAAMVRLGCTAEVDSIRAAKRRDLAGRATLSDRARLLVADPEKLADLGLLEPFEDELRAQLPQLLEALGRSEEPLAMALARSVALPVQGVRALATRLGFDLGPVSHEERNADDRPVPRFRADAPVRAPRPRPNAPVRERPPADHPSRPSTAATPRAPASRPTRPDRSPRAAAGRPGSRPASRPGGSSARAGGPAFRPRPTGGPDGSGRPGSFGRPGAPGRPSGRPTGPGGARPGSARPGSARPGSPRPGSARPGAGPRPGARPGPRPGSRPGSRPGAPKRPPR